MYRIQDNYRIKSHWSTDELTNHLSRTSNSQSHWSTDALTSHLSRICYWEIAINIWQQCKSSPKFANSPQYPIPSPQSLVPNPQYREQRTNAAKFLIENKFLSPPLKTVAASSGVSRVGFNYLKVLLNQLGRDIEVVNLATERTDDLMHDFVSIITSFCARLYSIRRRTRKTECIVKCLEEDE